MQELLLVRHAQSYANKRDLAFGNVESPLTERGIGEAVKLNKIFREQYGITPELYDRPVLASSYLRPQQTAAFAGFQEIHTNPLINESDHEAEIRSGLDIIARHARERWVPDMLAERARELIEKVRDEELTYQIYFTHGFFIAAVKSALAAEPANPTDPPLFEWDEKRGYIPRLATINPVTL